MTLNNGKEPRFGEPVCILAKLVREVGDGHRKTWNRYRLPETLNGMIIGERTLSNGYRSYEEWGVQYDPAEYFKAYLVVTDMRSKPFYVRPEDVRV
jgi:hypothetical protein